MSVLVPGGVGSAPGWRVWWSWRCPWRSTAPRRTAWRWRSAPAPLLVNPERSTPRWSTPMSAARSGRAPWTELATPAAASRTWTQEHTGNYRWGLGIFHFSTVPNPIPPDLSFVLNPVRFRLVLSRSRLSLLPLAPALPQLLSGASYLVTGGAHAGPGALQQVQSARNLSHRIVGVIPGLPCSGQGELQGPLLDFGGELPQADEVARAPCWGGHLTGGRFSHSSWKTNFKDKWILIPV